MVIKFSAGFVALSLLSVSCVSANPVSLFLPGAEGDEAFTADLLGTDSTGHTTWRIGVGSASGSFTATGDGAAAYPSVTLVEGSSDIHIIQAILTSGATDPNIPTQAEQDCVYSTAAGTQAGSAVCTIRLEAADETTTMVQTISGNVVEVQVAATVTGGSSSPSMPTVTGSGSAGTAGTSSSGTAAATQTQTGKGNGAGRTSSVAVPALVLAGLANVFKLLSY
ncbi:hypothetical protein GSI_11817 [Ganoderma sinense ZZ0214-1]|uniref:Uncharacterized protein n=1 Tax=Ganoderma sinense ZZ0214-1 TaxID=1077348 RepID=A0A2G8RX21_9APHY|nr:hypothetical protein GSI_11817 [Ganoderma sinense ZZ0214-1]